jgi:hypothetical protein
MCSGHGRVDINRIWWVEDRWIRGIVVAVLSTHISDNTTGYCLIYTSDMGGTFAILNPCSKKWPDLSGDGRARYCETCKTHVHSIADYSTEEWNRLWRESDGHVCGFLGGESRAPLRGRRTILFGLLVTACSPLFAASASVRFRVKDPIGGLVEHAAISVADKDDHPLRTLTTDGTGEAVFTNLPLGTLHFVVRAQGFSLKYLTILVHGYKELKIEATLDLGIVGEVVDSNKHAKHRGWLQY